MNKKQFIDYKEGVNNLDLNFIQPELLLLMGLINKWCADRDINFQITSIIRTKEQDQKLKAISKTHQQGRAFDFSLQEKHGWTFELIQELCNYLTELDRYQSEELTENPFYNIGAISIRTSQSTPIVVHKNSTGKGIHAHIQVRPRKRK